MSDAVMDPNLQETPADEVVETDPEERLRAAKKLFQLAVEHAHEYHVEAHKALRFYHNSEGEGQWEEDELAYLREQKRPAYVFNLIRPKVDVFLGMLNDAQRSPHVAPGSAEDDDKLLADVLDTVATQAMEDARSDRILGRVRHTATITGECCVQVEIEEDPKRPGWVKVSLFRVSPFDVHWDATSVEADRSDAGHAFQHKWMDKRQFLDEYPGHEEEWQTNSTEDEDTPHHWSMDDESDYDQHSTSDLYYDRRENKARVIRYEYKSKESVFTVARLDPMTMQPEQQEIRGEANAERALAAGFEILDEKRVDVVRVMEFIGSAILEEYDQAGPFDGFSLVPFVYEMDDETGTPYGMPRNLIDPQSELNQAKSLEMEHIAQGVATGSTIETGAVEDIDQFKEEGRRPGGVRQVKDGALTSGQVVDDQPVAPNAAVLGRAAGAVELFGEISGLPSNTTVSPAEHAQAAVTTALRYNRAMQSVSSPIASYEAGHECVLRKVIEGITQVMADEQILAMLSRQGYVIEGTQIIETEQGQGPDGQPMAVPKAAADIRSIRDLHYNVELRQSSHNSTARLTELQVLQELGGGGVPIDPEVMVEMAVSDRGIQERLKKFAEEASQAQAQQTQMEQQMQQAQLAQVLQVEQLKSEVAMMKAQMDAQVDVRGQDVTALTDILKLIEGADEAERDRIWEWIQAQAEPTNGGMRQ